MAKTLKVVSETKFDSYWECPLNPVQKSLWSRNSLKVLLVSADKLSVFNTSTGKTVDINPKFLPMESFSFLEGRQPHPITMRQDPRVLVRRIECFNPSTSQELVIQEILATGEHLVYCLNTETGRKRPVYHSSTLTSTFDVLATKDKLLLVKNSQVTGPNQSPELILYDSRSLKKITSLDPRTGFCLGGGASKFLDELYLFKPKRHQVYYEDPSGARMAILDRKANLASSRHFVVIDFHMRQVRGYDLRCSSTEEVVGLLEIPLTDKRDYCKVIEGKDEGAGLLKAIKRAKDFEGWRFILGHKERTSLNGLVGNRFVRIDDGNFGLQPKYMVINLEDGRRGKESLSFNVNGKFIKFDFEVRDLDLLREDLTTSLRSSEPRVSVNWSPEYNSVVMRRVIPVEQCTEMAQINQETHTKNTKLARRRKRRGSHRSTRFTHKMTTNRQGDPFDLQILTKFNINTQEVDKVDLKLIQRHRNCVHIKEWKQPAIFCNGTGQKRESKNKYCQDSENNFLIEMSPQENNSRVIKINVFDYKTEELKRYSLDTNCIPVAGRGSVHQHSNAWVVGSTLYYCYAKNPGTAIAMNLRTGEYTLVANKEIGFVTEEKNSLYLYEVWGEAAEASSIGVFARLSDKNSETSVLSFVDNQGEELSRVQVSGRSFQKGGTKLITHEHSMVVMGIKSGELLVFESKDSLGAYESISCTGLENIYNNLEELKNKFVAQIELEAGRNDETEFQYKTLKIEKGDDGETTKIHMAAELTLAGKHPKSKLSGRIHIGYQFCVEITQLFLEGTWEASASTQGKYVVSFSPMDRATPRIILMNNQRCWETILCMSPSTLWSLEKRKAVRRNHRAELEKLVVRGQRLEEDDLEGFLVQVISLGHKYKQVVQEVMGIREVVEMTKNIYPLVYYYYWAMF